MGNRESKIACRVTARKMMLAGMDHGYRIFKDYLILWAEGRTRSDRTVLSELKMLQEDVTDEVKYGMKDFSFSREVSRWSLQPGVMKSTNKGVYVLSEVWINTDQIDIDSALSELNGKGWREGRPVSKR